MSQCSVIFWAFVANNSLTSAENWSILPLCRLAISWSSLPILAYSGLIYSVFLVRISYLIVVSCTLGRSILSTCLGFQLVWYRLRKHI